MVEMVDTLKDDDFETTFRKASQRGSDRLEAMPKAVSARFEARSERMVFDLENGVTLFVPVGLIQGLQGASTAALVDFTLVNHGTQIHWNELDVQFYVEGLLTGVFGTPKWMSSLKDHLTEIGKRGGESKSTAKSAASRENGKKGGRPSRKVA